MYTCCRSKVEEILNTGSEAQMTAVKYKRSLSGATGESSSGKAENIFGQVGSVSSKTLDGNQTESENSLKVKATNGVNILNVALSLEYLEAAFDLNAALEANAKLGPLETSTFLQTLSSALQQAGANGDKREPALPQWLHDALAHTFGAFGFGDNAGRAAEVVSTVATILVKAFMLGADLVNSMVLKAN